MESAIVIKFQPKIGNDERLAITQTGQVIYFPYDRSCLARRQAQIRQQILQLPAQVAATIENAVRVKLLETKVRRAKRQEAPKRNVLPFNTNLAE